MAGAGYKLFNTGDVLTAAQVNTYLNEQTVMVFASSAARTSALSGVLAEGMVSYLQDTNAVEVYNGSAWVGVSGAGDITEVQAGTGISVASGTGPIPVVTNTVATAFDAAGDLVYGTGADTFTKLSLGTAGKVLTVNSGATAPEWATPAGGGGGMTLLSTTTLTGATTTINISDNSYINLAVFVTNMAGPDSYYRMAVNGSNTLHFQNHIIANDTTITTDAVKNTYWFLTSDSIQNDTLYIQNAWQINLYQYASSSVRKIIDSRGAFISKANQIQTTINSAGYFNSNDAITSLVFSTDSGNLTGGTVKVYGVK